MSVGKRTSPLKEAASNMPKTYKCMINLHSTYISIYIIILRWINPKLCVRVCAYVCVCVCLIGGGALKFGSLVALGKFDKLYISQLTFCYYMKYNDMHAKSLYMYSVQC